MSVQLYCCVFSYVDQYQELKVPLIRPSLHVLVVLYDAVVLIGYTDRRTALDERFLYLSIVFFQRSITLVYCFNSPYHLCVVTYRTPFTVSMPRQWVSQ